MMTKWKTEAISTSTIKEVEVTRETELCVYVRVQGCRGKTEHREAKLTDYHAYHDSWDEAKLYLLSRAESDVLSARNALQRANDKLGNIKGLKQPDPVAP